MAWTKMILALGLAALVGWTVASAAEEKPPAAAPAAAKPEPLTPEQLREALAGFKGFLAGEVVARRDTGLVLFVRSITLVEGNRAQNPGLLLSREAPVEYATEKDEKGDVQPRKSLVSLMERIEKLPAIAFGVPGGGNIMIMMGDGGDAVGGAVVAEGHAEVHAGRIIRGGALRLEMNGQRIQIGGEPDDAKDAPGAEKPDKPRGPAATLRVLAQDDGTLVMDRALPGMQPAATWNGMAVLHRGQMEAAPDQPKEPPKEEKAPKKGQF